MGDWTFTEVQRGTPTTLGFLYRYEDRIDREGHDTVEHVDSGYGKIVLCKFYIQRKTAKGAWIQKDKYSINLSWVGENNKKYATDINQAKKDFLRRKQAVLEIANRRASTARQLWCAAAEEWGFDSKTYKLNTVHQVYGDDIQVRNLNLNDEIPY